MITASGASCWPQNNGVPTLADIAQGLGRIARFAGQTKLWYPVLAHVIVCADMMPSQWAIYGLMHDAPESMTSDIPTPWKAKSQRELEHTLYERICKAHGLMWPIPAEVQAAVDEADYQCLLAEANVLGHAAPELCVRRSVEDRNDLVPIDATYNNTIAAKIFHMLDRHGIDMMDPDYAANLFMRHYEIHMANAESGLAGLVWA